MHIAAHRPVAQSNLDACISLYEKVGGGAPLHTLAERPPLEASRVQNDTPQVPIEAAVAQNEVPKVAMQASRLQNKLHKVCHERATGDQGGTRGRTRGVPPLRTQPDWPF